MLKRLAKKMIFKSEFKTGRHKKTGSVNHRLILMYHGVSLKDLSKLNRRHLDTDQFEEHLIYFTKNFSILSMPEIVDQKEKGEKPFIALTFDDGYANNLMNALPLLEKYNVPATFFIPALLIDKSDAILYADKVDIVRSLTKEKELIFHNRAFPVNGKIVMRDEFFGKGIYDLLQNLPTQELQRSMKNFCTRYNFNDSLKEINSEGYKLMDTKQLKQLADSPMVTIGSHAYSHYALDTCSNQEIENELKNSKVKLEACIQKEITSIAYPYGIYNKRIISLSKEAGYKTLVAAGEVQDPGSVVPRVGIISGGTFEQNMLSIHKAFDRFGF